MPPGLACRNHRTTAPSGIAPASRKCHSATISLRANATMVIQRSRPEPIPARVWNHRASLLSAWLRNHIQASSMAIVRARRLPGGVDPQNYLADVITRIVNGHPNSHIDELLPWA